MKKKGKSILIGLLGDFWNYNHLIIVHEWFQEGQSHIKCDTGKKKKKKGLKPVSHYECQMFP